MQDTNYNYEIDDDNEYQREDIEESEYDETTINIIDDENTYNTLMEIEKIVLKNNGIIYGSYVTSKILHNYNTSQFYQLNDDVDKFWDINYSLNTIDRFMKIKTMKINFNTVNDYMKFVKEMGKIFKNMCIRIFNYSYFNDFSKIILNISLTTQTQLYINNVFICDGFIMKNINGKKTITYSSNTNTPYDYINGTLKKTVEKNIIKDICRKKTMCISENLSNDEILTLIIEMVSFGWTIVNLPYTIISSTDDLLKTPEIIKFRLANCSICLEQLFNNAKKTEISILYKDIFNPTSSYYPIHHNCLLNYFEYQINDNTFMCPYRYKINYNDCKMLADFNYYKLSVNN